MLSKKNKLILYSFLYLNKTQKKQFWVHPYNLERPRRGYYYTVCEDIDKYPDRFHNLFRMSPTTFNFILELINEDLKGIGTNYRCSISPKQKLCVTLIFLAHGGSFRKLAIDFRLGFATVRKIVKQTCEAIIKHLEPIFLASQTSEDWVKTRNDFLRLWQMPNCAGALDGKHIQIFKPQNSGSKYFNYKKAFSIVLMAICDAQYKFLMVDIGAYGLSSDGGIFANSVFGKAWLNKDPALKIPEDAPLPGTNIKIPLTLVADEAFPLRSNILTPYSGKNLTYEKRIFNYRLSRARRMIENAFGILTHTFRVLLSRMILQPTFATSVVKCCTILHNLLRDQQKMPQRNIVLSASYEGPIHNPNEAIEIRKTVSNWFVNQGKLDWQDNHI